MRTCNVIPDTSTCNACLETQQMFNVVDDCDKCECKNREYELIKVGCNFWGGYAIVILKGVPEKIPLRRIINIQNK